MSAQAEVASAPTRRALHVATELDALRARIVALDLEYRLAETMYKSLGEKKKVARDAGRPEVEAALKTAIQPVKAWMAEIDDERAYVVVTTFVLELGCGHHDRSAWMAAAMDALSVSRTGVLAEIRAKLVNLDEVRLRMVGPMDQGRRSELEAQVAEGEDKLRPFVMAAAARLVREGVLIMGDDKVYHMK